MVSAVDIVCRPVLTSHAKQRMRERGAALDDVLEALSEPVQLVYDKAKDVYLSLGSNGIAVVFAWRGSICEVVTVLREREYEALLRRLGSRRYKVLY